MLRYGSVCSGIEAASVAWSPLGWEAQFLSEIEAFPCAVLKHHYPDVVNHGDMTRFQEWPDHAIDLLVGGTPCQSFSVAGLRAGLADPRGNLMLTYLAVAARYRPRWVLWENVFGVLSSGGGRDFGALLGGLVQLGYGFAYRVLDAQFVRTSGHPVAVPQRRRRVFVVGYLGDWRRAAAVLFDAASLRGDSPPRREAGQNVAPTISARPTGGGGLGTDFDLDGGLTAVAQTLRSGPTGGKSHGKLNGSDRMDLIAIEAPSVSPALKARDAKGPSSDGDGDGDGDGAPLIAHALRAEGHDASEDGTGSGTPIIASPIAASLTRGAESSGKGGYAGRRQEDDTNIIAFNARQDPIPGPGVTGPLDVDGTTQAIAWSIMPQNSGKDYKARAVDVSQPVMAAGPTGGNQGGDYIQQAWAVRRLTPRECCRLQGFPDDYLSQVLYRGKAPADGPMYKALGNSMAVNVMAAIGERIAMVEAM